MSQGLTAVRPPEFAPRLEVAALLLVADRVVLADTFAFSRQSYHNRARIWTDQGARWLTVPRRHAGLGQPLTDVEVVDDGWRRRHRVALQAAYGAAPFYEHVAPEWSDVLDTPGSLADLAVASTVFAARWLRAPASLVRASDLPSQPHTLAAIVAATGSPELVSIPEAAPHDARLLPGHPVRVLHLDRQRPPAGRDVSVLDLLMHHGLAAGTVLSGWIRIKP